MNISSLNGSLFNGEITVSHKIPRIFAYCLLFVTSIVGNSFIVWTIYKDSRLRTNTNILVANMAVSDFLFALLNCPHSIVETMFDEQWMLGGDVGLAFCKLIPFLSDVPTAVSLYSCVFVAIDRYCAVVHPLRGGFSRSRLKYIIPAIWIASSAVLSPYLYYFKLMHYHPVISCELKSPFIYVFAVIIFSIGITAPVITIIYALIVYKRCRYTVPGEQTESVRRLRDKQNRNVINLSVAVVLPLYVTELTFAITVLLNLFGKLNNMSYEAHNDLIFATVFLKRTSIAYNFFVYLIFNEVYRENFKNLMSKCFCTCFRVKVSISPSEPGRMEMNILEPVNSKVKVLSVSNLAYDSI